MSNEALRADHKGLHGAMMSAYREDETQVVERLIEAATLSAQQKQSVRKLAYDLVATVREHRLGSSGLDAFLFQYDLSSDEGIVLMCLAEALLRIPDSRTINRLIKDKITAADWEAHAGKSHSLFVNAATWGLMLTGQILDVDQNKEKKFGSVFKRLANRGGEPLIRKAVSQAMKIMGKQFVMAPSIKEALKRARDHEKQGYLYSYDMLGEAAWTAEDAKEYFNAYMKAIEAIGAVAKGKGPIRSPGISIKLSAIHPRYEYVKKEQLLQELLPRLKELALAAKRYNIGLTVDAEEADRLEISLVLMEALICDPDLADWDGLGLAVQAYQKRAYSVIKWLVELARKQERHLMVRLVKGAYWDSEIKWAQELGMSGYPVFTRKSATDVSYVACAKLLLDATDIIYPQFATHNAYTLATIVTLAEGKGGYEFQCLHGMGDALYNEVVGKDKLNIPCRIYAPVGVHKDLLAYLVRRLLENGANTSFVNRIVDEKAPIESLVRDPVDKLSAFEKKPHPKILLPIDIYTGYRRNSKGLDLSNADEWSPVMAQMHTAMEKQYSAVSTGATFDKANAKPVVDPHDLESTIGYVQAIEADAIDPMIVKAADTFKTWSATPVEERALCLEQAAVLLEQNRANFMALLVREAGKTLPDAIAELREAIDFCWYYSAQAKKHFSAPTDLPGPTGETNQIRWEGRGVIACISPWNFPLAIFMGQVVAALAAGNTVLAKPADQTPLVAALAIELLHQAGVPTLAVQLITGRGSQVGPALVDDERIAGVMFTGSTDTAQRINQGLAARQGAIVPLIAETGGQNCMIVDSSALPEQVTQDVLHSAFYSAGQRCSALRVLFLQDDVADTMIDMIKGAMAELVVGDPIQLATDIGPVIDRGSVDSLQTHVDMLEQSAKLIYRVPVADNLRSKGSYFAPVAYEIDSIKQLTEEVFGPVLHVVRFAAKDLDRVIDEINQTGFGLTLGVHSRISETIEHIAHRAHVGNVYVNRNMVGAVVGVQPFGGERLSGTGPKAGGPHYLLRLATERTVTVNTTASGGNASLMSLGEN